MIVLKPFNDGLVQPLLKRLLGVVYTRPSNHATGGENGTIMVGIFVSLCLASKMPSEWEFFVPAGTDLADEAELKKIADKEIYMSDTYLGRYAAMQKKNTVAAVLDFMDEEWESLKRLKEGDMMRGITNASKEGNNNNNVGGLRTENGANGGEINEEAV